MWANWLRKVIDSAFALPRDRRHLVTGGVFVGGVGILLIKFLRGSTSIGAQGPFLRHGSVRENRDVDNEHTDADIWDAPTLVETSDAVCALDNKLDRLVVDEESFFEDQRQLLCRARAL